MARGMSDRYNVRLRTSAFGCESNPDVNQQVWSALRCRTTLAWRRSPSC